MATKTPPEGFVYDGEHLVEAGLGTWHPWYDADGRAIKAVFVPYPLPAIEYTTEQLDAMAQAKRGKRRRRH